MYNYNIGISKNTPFPLQWRGIKGEAKQIIRVFRDAHILDKRIGRYFFIQNDFVRNDSRCKNRKPLQEGFSVISMKLLFLFAGQLFSGFAFFFL